MADPPPTGQGALSARVDALERERRRAFEDAQRQADALFAQYQLSQLIASGGNLPDLAASVLNEVLRLADAAGGALWLGTDEAGMSLVAVAGDVSDPAPPADPTDPEDARTWTGTHPATGTCAMRSVRPSASSRSAGRTVRSWRT